MTTKETLGAGEALLIGWALLVARLFVEAVVAPVLSGGVAGWAVVIFGVCLSTVAVALFGYSSYISCIGIWDNICEFRRTRAAQRSATK